MRFHNPITYGAIYISAIPFFGFVYYYIQGFDEESRLSFLNCIYFSTITITALGYGDIVPTAAIVRSIAAIQSLIEVGIAGLFLLAVSNHSENKRRLMIRRNLLEYYRRKKKEIAYEIVFTSRRGGRSELSADDDTIEKIMTVDGFRQLFQGGRTGDEGFYAFRNGLAQDEFRHKAILVSLRALANRIELALLSGAVSSKASFERSSALMQFLLNLESHGTGYDEEPPLSGFLYQIFSGWDPVDGYLEYDRVERYISELS